MRIVLKIAGVVLIVVGVIFFLQGINLLPGSFMTGQTKWAIYGALMLIGGIAIIVLKPTRL